MIVRYVDFKFEALSLQEYRRAENRPWVAAIAQKYFKMTGRAAEQTIGNIEEYFEALVYDEDIPYGICRSCLEKALKERGAEHLHITLDRATLYAMKTV
jgi:hypothetical protein